MIEKEETELTEEDLVDAHLELGNTFMAKAVSTNNAKRRNKYLKIAYNSIRKVMIINGLIENGTKK